MDRTLSYEQNDLLAASIDKNLSALEERAQDGIQSDSYEKNNDGSYTLKVDGINLDVPLKNPENLVRALKLTHKIMDIYIKSGYTKEKFYAQEDSSSKGHLDSQALMDLVLNNRLMFDTTFLTEESFKKAFGKNPSRGNDIMTTYANFLNQIINKKRSEYESPIMKTSYIGSRDATSEELNNHANKAN